MYDLNQTTTELDLDETLQILAANYRRWVLYLLLNRDVGTLEELVPLLWLLSEAAGGDRVDETRLTIQLQQIHLPKLADAGLIEYDHRTGDIALTEKANAVREQLATIERWEEPAVRAEIQESL